MVCHDLIKSAVYGHYEQSFFGSIDTDQSVDAGDNLRRLRAVIQFLNIQFARSMRMHGCKYIFTDQKGQETFEDYLEDRFASEASLGLGEAPRETGKHRQPKEITRQEALDWILRVLQRSRGVELPGNFNPMLISQPFWELSTPWEVMAMNHVEEVASICQQFVRGVLQTIASTAVEAHLSRMHVDNALQAALVRAREELHKILEDKRRHPITYNHYYTTTIQKKRSKKYNEALQKLAQRNGNGAGDSNTLDFADDLFEPHLELNMDRFSANDALESTIAFYKQELKYFIDVVTKQVIERQLVSTLPTIISPIVVTGMTDEEIVLIAAEPTEVSERRKFLQARVQMLKDGQEMFRQAIGGPCLC